mmetsp:Transcript_29705/g.97157  ORF Transcript_29705/g.97157 Transcript_29705/m.97157 type:complete len:338 (-) Transcript_29705:811-1824(-)
MLQSSPRQWSRHSHTSSLHTPLPEQSFRQPRLTPPLQSSPQCPSSHMQRPSSQTPLPEQRFGQVGAWRMMNGFLANDGTAATSCSSRLVSNVSCAMSSTSAFFSVTASASRHTTRNEIMTNGASAAVTCRKEVDAVSKALPMEVIRITNGLLVELSRFVMASLMRPCTTVSTSSSARPTNRMLASTNATPFFGRFGSSSDAPTPPPLPGANRLASDSASASGPSSSSDEAALCESSPPVAPVRAPRRLPPSAPVLARCSRPSTSASRWPVSRSASLSGTTVPSSSSSWRLSSISRALRYSSLSCVTPRDSRSQATPSKPSSHMHLPSTHMPLPEHSG